jgi:hypothetical protein
LACVLWAKCIKRWTRLTLSREISTTVSPTIVCDQLLLLNPELGFVFALLIFQMAGKSFNERRGRWTEERGPFSSKVRRY